MSNTIALLSVLKIKCNYQLIIIINVSLQPILNLVHNKKSREQVVTRESVIKSINE